MQYFRRISDVCQNLLLRTLTKENLISLVIGDNPIRNDLSFFLSSRQGHETQTAQSSSGTPDAKLHCCRPTTSCGFQFCFTYHFVRVVIWSCEYHILTFRQLGVIRQQVSAGSQDVNVGCLDQVLFIIIHERTKWQNVQHAIGYQIDIIKLTNAFLNWRPNQFVGKLPRFNDLVFVGKIVLNYRAILKHRLLHRIPVRELNKIVGDLTPLLNHDPSEHMRFITVGVHQNINKSSVLCKGSLKSICIRTRDRCAVTHACAA